MGGKWGGYADALRRGFVDWFRMRRGKGGGVSCRITGFMGEDGDGNVFWEGGCRYWELDSVITIAVYR